MSLPVAKRARNLAFLENLENTRDYNALLGEIETLETEIKFIKALLESKPSAANELNARNKALQAEVEMLLDTLDDLTSDPDFKGNRESPNDENLARALKENEEIWKIEQNILKEKIAYLEGMLDKERQATVSAQNESTKLMNMVLELSKDD